jgi:pimeloyl-ACP methyl ester carboxylesterase
VAWPERLPNLPLPTLGGKQLWGDVFACGDWRIQQSVATGHHRLLGPRDVRFAAGSYAHCLGRFTALKAAGRVEPVSPRLVICLHGIFRSKHIWRPMASALRTAGYQAVALNYPSTRRSIEAHADQVERVLDHAPAETQTVSFVTHSLGGIVAREVLSRESAWRARIRPERLVMIATPNRGAEIVPWLERIPGAGLIAGPALGQLHPERLAVPPPTIPFATIAGGRGDPRGWNPLLPGDDDMTVSVSSVQLPGAEDELVLSAVHTFIPADPRVIAATVRYLATGKLSA